MSEVKVCMTLDCQIYHLHNGSNRTLCDRRVTHDEKYITYDAQNKIVMQPIPVESFGRESPDGRYFPCCKVCLAIKVKFDNLQSKTEEWI